mmetsp:Transcript_8504/g.18388  ORF Transcript_8504/g.18388 Transcript_8504/m.18388 type:complete len:421 (+) Transcript_8504:267-1529(+)
MLWAREADVSPPATTPKKNKGGLSCICNVVLGIAFIVVLQHIDSFNQSIPAVSCQFHPWYDVAPSHSSDAHAREREKGSLKRSNTKLEIPVGFTIRPNRTVAWYRGGTALRTFHSFVPLISSSNATTNNNNIAGYQVVYKVNTQDKTLPSKRSQRIETMRLSSKFEDVEGSRHELRVRIDDNGIRKQSGLSDPRAFFWNGSAHALAWRYNGRERDHENYLFNLDTGEEVQLDDCIRGYRGKNWIPLVYREQLYVVYRLSPHIEYFKYDAHHGCPEPPSNVTEANRDGIDEWRGGSNFVPYGPSSMISLGHRTVDSNTHIPYLMHVDMIPDQNEIRSKARKRRLFLPREEGKNETNWTGILDPTSLWWGEDGTLWMGTVRTSGRWKKCYFKDTEQCVFNMTIYEVELKYKHDVELSNYMLT